MNHPLSHIAQLPTRGAWKGVLTLGLSVLGAAVLAYLLMAGHLRIAIILTLATLFVALARIRIQAAILASVVYLVFMGDFRRLLIPLVGWTGADPLLLLGPAFAIFLFGYAVASGSIRLDTPLAWWTAALMAVMALQVFNPRQGGLMVGVAGLLFFMVPLLWFWIGRTYATPSFMKTLLYKVIVPLAVLAMLMGYYQTFFGYLSYQMQWYEIAGYTALGPAFALKPISFFASSTAHAMFLSAAIIVLWVAVLRGHSAALLLIPFLFVAVFLVGSRGPIVKIIATAAGLWAVLGKDVRAWVSRGILALLIGGVGLVWSLNQVTQIESGSADVEYYISRQTEGLLGATEQGSSANVHLRLMMHGFKQGFSYPLGLGLGATTKAAAKFGTGRRNTEVDISNVFVSTGVIGGVIYLIVIFWVFLTAVRYWRRTRSRLALALLGLPVLTILGWLSGMYVITTLIWLCIGALDQFERDERDKRDPSRSNAQ